MVASSAAAGNAGRTAAPSRQPYGVSPASAWASSAPELTEWAWDRYVIRAEVWGGYTALEDRGKERHRADGSTYKVGATLPRPPLSRRGREVLTPAVLTRHFRARGPLDVVGLHTTSADNTSRTGTVEIDNHGPSSNPPEVNAAAARW